VYGLGQKKKGFLFLFAATYFAYLCARFHNIFMNTQIRFAHKNDVPVIRDMIQQLAKFEKLEHEMVATDAQLEKTLFGNPAYAEVLLLEEVSEAGAFAVGMALFFHSYSTFLAKPGIFLEDLFVLPQCRSRGYGKRLLEKLAALAVERDCGRLEWSVLDWNKEAIRFYESLGAKAMSDWTGYRLAGESLQKFAKS
jgi:GNAT superfamily N-acetyltransferase